MARNPDADRAGIYAVAGRFADRCLRRNGSLHTSGTLWSPEAVAALGRRYDRRFAATDGDFGARWAAVLHRAPTDLRRLAAEALHVHLLAAADVSGPTKRRLLAASLGLDTPDALRLPPAVAACLDAGVAPTGVAFKATRGSQVRYLLRAAEDCKTLPPRARTAVLADPWACARWLDGLPVEGGAPQREALKHLLHPDTFEAIVSVRVKRRISRAFADVIALDATDDGDGDHSDGGTDARLAAIRSALEPDHGPGFSFADDALAVRWR
jgi:5-methylcytosine-specific restriction enzyme B